MWAFAQNAILVVVPFLAIITVIVTVHELGHFLTAKACGVAIERFSIGFGRALLSWRDRAGVEWRIAWAPIGGYVRFALDENVASVPDEEDLEAMRARIVAAEGAGAERKYLPFKPLWQRALIVFAGPAANFLLASVLFSMIFAVVGEVVWPNRVAAVVPASAAAAAGFRPGDRIVAADGQAMADFTDVTQYVALHDIVPIDFQVRRGTASLHIVVTPRLVRQKSEFGGSDVRGVLGIVAAGSLVRLDPLTAVGRGAGETWGVLRGTAIYFGRLITGRVDLSQLHGVIGMARMSGAITRHAIAEAPHDPGFQILAVVVNLVNFAALISVSLGFMNLLPLPILDGGHLLFYAYEWIARRPLGVRVQAAGYRVGLALLVGLMLFANLHDLPLTRVFHFFGSLFS
jgi:regulator of sigma E protease